MTIPLEKRVLHFGWQVGCSILIAVFGAGLWAQRYLDKQDKIYEYVIRREKKDSAYDDFMDSMKKSWRPMAIKKRAIMEADILEMHDEVNGIKDALNFRHQTTELFTERRVNGRIIFERAKTTK
jgi:hypothetical protein